MDAKHSEELPCDARILAEDGISALKGLPDTRRDVLEVADGRPHHGEHACHQSRSLLSKLESAIRASQFGSLPDVFQVWKNQAGQSL